MSKGLKGRKETLQVLMRDGSMEVDTNAIKVGSQLVSNMMNGAALPVRKPTPTYVHKEVNRAPLQRSGVHFETVDPVPPDFDSAFVQRDAPEMWNAAKLDLDREIDSTRRLNNWLQGIAVVVSSIVLLASVGVASAGSQAGGDAEAQAEVSRPVGPPPLPPLPPNQQPGR